MIHSAHLPDETLPWQIVLEYRGHLRGFRQRGHRYSCNYHPPLRPQTTQAKIRDSDPDVLDPESFRGDIARSSVMPNTDLVGIYPTPYQYHPGVAQQQLAMSGARRLSSNLVCQLQFRADADPGVTAGRMPILRPPDRITYQRYPSPGISGTSLSSKGRDLASKRGRSLLATNAVGVDLVRVTAG